MTFQPTRMDLLTRERASRDQFFRLVLVDGRFELDLSKERKGRGYYVLRKKEVLEKMRKKNPLLRFSKSTDYERLFRKMEEEL